MMMLRDITVQTNLLFRVLALLCMILVWRTSAAAPVFVNADWVSKHIDDPSVVLVDMAAEGTQYQRFHLRGAVYLPYQAIVQRRRDGVMMRVDDERLFKILGALGISAQSHVVIYDDIGGLQAGRLFWELERIGHAKVSVLDGGLVQWILDGGKVMATPVTPKPVNYSPRTGGARQNEASLEAVKSAAKDAVTVLLDVRTREEYQGEPRSKRPTGHIPGAKWWPWDGAVAFDNGFRLKTFDQLQKSLASVGVENKDQPIITYCQTGHRASQAYLTLRSLGYENVRVFDGSMAEYVRDRRAPLQLGAQP
jgi:thiosulfate/3-mercaptopyruvate sulfurtransferase